MKHLLLLSLFIAPCAFAQDGVDSLKPAVTAKFLALANDARSPTGVILHKVNDDNTDGRNPNGVYKFPMNDKSIRVVPVTGEDVFGSYCHENEDQTLDCDASDVTENYLVLVPYQFGVHKAGEYGTTSFKVTAERTVHTHSDAKGHELSRKVDTTISEPAQVTL